MVKQNPYTKFSHNLGQLQSVAKDSRGLTFRADTEEMHSP